MKIITCLCLSSINPILLGAYDNGVIFICNYEYNDFNQFKGHDSQVSTLSFFPDGNYFLSIDHMEY